MSAHHGGLALDIDETISDTLGTWIPLLLRHCGGPSHLSPREIVTTYHHTRNVPEWQSAEAMALIDRLIHDDDLQTRIAPIEGAVEAVRQIGGIIPITVYVTTRPEIVRGGTQRWLRMHHFPDVPVIHRPSHVAHLDGNTWKARELESHYPHIVGVIDNDPLLPASFSRTYRGKVFVYNYPDTLDITHTLPKSHLFRCRDWEEVLSYVREVYAPQ